jgi:hypothetical protein
LPILRERRESGEGRKESRERESQARVTAMDDVVTRTRKFNA